MIQMTARLSYWRRRRLLRKASAGFTLRSMNPSTSEEDRVAATTDGQTAAIVFSPQTDWNMVVATFLPAP